MSTMALPVVWSNPVAHSDRCWAPGSDDQDDGSLIKRALTKVRTKRLLRELSRYQDSPFETVLAPALPYVPRSIARISDVETIVDKMTRIGQAANVPEAHIAKAANIIRGLLSTDTSLGYSLSPDLSASVPDPIMVFDDSEDEFIIEWFHDKYHVEITVPMDDEMYIRAAGFGPRSLSEFCRTLPGAALRSCLNMMYSDAE